MQDLLDRLKTALADRYTIERELGSGGMATVYLAQDVKHHRKVAVKVLRPELAAALGPERFLREIETTANLNHPHILPLFDSGEADAFLYYVMPYVEGESLRDRLNRETQLPIDDALQIAREVADALSFAHSHDVIHRDIKPENILLEAGHAVVADFGIAKAITAAGGERLTETGVAIGTVEYMSPEQAAASGEVDARSDIYSLGCVLYETLAGQPPFTGPTVESVLRQQIVEEAPPVTVMRSSVPAQVADVIRKALAKTPADRFRSAQDLGEALTAPPTVSTLTERGAPTSATPSRWSPRVIGMVAAAAAIVVAAAIFALRPGGAGADLDPNAVVVLPFRVSGDASLENLREGMLDLLHAKLTGDGIPRAVDPRTVLAAWRRVGSDDGGDLAVEASLDVAAGVGAGRLLLGSIVGIGSNVTMSGELRRVPDGGILARASVTNTADSLIPLTDRFVAQILSRLGGEAEERVGDLTTRSWPALRAYLAGRQSHRRGRYREAMDRFGDALDIDSTFALAALGRRSANLSTNVRQDDERAWALRDRLSNRDRAYLEAFYGGGDGPLTSRQKIVAAQAAVDLAPDHLDALGRLGYMLHSRGPYVDWPASQDRAREALDRAIALDSSYAYAMEIRLWVAFLTGDTTHVRRLSDLLWASDSTGDRAAYTRWRAARELGDSAVLRALRPRFAELGGFLLRVVSFTILDGLPADDAERAAAALEERATTTPQRITAMEQGGRLAAAQGRVRAAAAALDSAVRLGHLAAATHLLDVALIDPGYDGAAAVVVEHFNEENWGSWISYVCKRELWRIEHGDAATAAETLSHLSTLLSERNVRSFCPLLLEARLEFLDTKRTSWPAFERLDSLMQEGYANDPASRLANLYIARWRETQGDYAAALAAVRRRFYRGFFGEALSLAAYLRQEGRLAAAVGDTAGAIRAYDHYLRLRTAPDPGPMQEEVDQVRAELARLVGEGRRD